MHFIYYDERTQKKYLICVQTKYNSFFLCFFSQFYSYVRLQILKVIVSNGIEASSIE